MCLRHENRLYSCHMDNRKVIVECAPGRVIKVLVKAMLFLVGMHVGIQVLRLGFNHDELLGLIPYFNLDEEHNFPSMFSSLLFVMTGGLLAVIAHLTSLNKGKFHLQWIGMAIIFMWLGCDEMLVIHEQWTPFIKAQLHTSGFFNNLWQLPYLAIFSLFALWYVPFFKSLHPRVRLQMFLAALLYALGVMVLEAVGGKLYELYGPGVTKYIIEVTFEETCEMCGLILFIYALLNHIRLTFGEFVIKLAR